MFKKISTYLPSLDSRDYKVPLELASLVNFFYDVYFAKTDERARLLEESRRNREIPPLDPVVDLKEQWLNSEIHEFVSISQSYPVYAKARNAWAFWKMFIDADSVYDIVPVVDNYKYKEAVKSYFAVEREQVNVDLNVPSTLPVNGNFFITHKTTGINLIISIDFCFYNMGCSISVNAGPQHQKEAEEFFQNFQISLIKNDIYYKRILSYHQGYIDFHDIKNTSWSDLVLKDKTIEQIRVNTVEVIRNMETLKSVGMCPNRNTLLISPPGMGKTTIFRATSCEMVGDATVVWCTGKSIRYPEDVTSLFEAVRDLSPCVVFLEDMDLFGRERGGLEGNASQVFNEFLSCLDGAQENSGVIVMASTNDAGSMDSALLHRPGRFHTKIEVPLPDAIDRGLMLKKFLSSNKCLPDETVTKETIDNVIRIMDGMTGDYIKELVSTIVLKVSVDGRATSEGIVFGSNDVQFAAAELIENYRIGQWAKLHHKYTNEEELQQM